MKYNICVPYRNRESQLKVFLEKFPEYFKNQSYGSDFNLIIVEQDNTKQFNLGCLINVGYDLFKNGILDYKYNSNDCYIFHPVDNTPINVDYSLPDGIGYTLYSTPHQCAHTEYYFKGVGWRNSTYESMNGYSNKYWGYSAEDDDMIFRLSYLNLPAKRASCIFESLEKDDVPDNTNKDQMRSLYYHTRMTGDRSSGFPDLKYEVKDKNILGPNIMHVKVDI